MAARTLVAVLVSAVVTASAVAGPVAVRSWVTPKPGQTPFAPPPGDFAPEMACDLSPWGWEKVAGFVGDERWAAPDTPYTPGESRPGSADYRFTYHAEVTDGASGQSAVLSIDGQARAEWIQRYDGLVLVDRVAVWFDLSPDWPVARLGDRTYQLQIRETVTRGDWVDTEVGLTAWPAAVPEPGTLGLGACGLALAVGMWRRKKQRRAVLTADHLPQ